MRIALPDDLSDGFTRIPNALFELNLTPSMERAWVRLATLDRGDFSKDFSNLENIAEAIGYNRSALFRVIKEMKDAGLVIKANDVYQLTIPGEPLEKKIPQPKPQAEKPQEEKTIGEELAEEPRRVNKMSEAEAKQIFVETWNQHKPESYMDERKSMNPATWIAIELQAKRLKVERQGYAEFVKSICRGLRADDWWNEKTFRVSNVFGYSANIEDKKFQSVEKLWKAGQTKEAKSAAFTGSTTDFLDWYNSKGFPVKTVVTLEVSDWNEGHTKEQEILTSSEVDRSVARVYYSDGKPVYWSGKMNQKALYYLP
jgi:hypothetical protein